MKQMGNDVHPPQRLNATDCLDPQGSIVQSAACLADRVVAILRAEHDVSVSFRNLRGASSSYFNTLLGTAVKAVGLDAVQQRVQFEFDSTVQREVFNRSLESIRKQVA